MLRSLVGSEMCIRDRYMGIINHKPRTQIQNLSMDRHTKFYDLQELETYGNQMIKLVCDLYQKQDQYPVHPNIKPGSVRQQLPEHPPQQGESFEDIIKDTEKLIFPNMTHWQHPKLFGYYPATISHAAVIADIFNNGFLSPGITWYCCPAAAELENHVMDWAAEFLHLPECFKFSSTGGGQICTTTCDAIMLTVHASKQLKMKEHGITNADPRITKLVAYISDMGYHFEKPIRMKDIPHVRKIPYKWNPEKADFELDPEDYRRAIEQDIKDGLIPFWVGINMGTTSTCQVDPIAEISAICKANGLFVCVDAAYLGAAQVCEEYEYLWKQLDNVDYYIVNFAKWMLSGLNGTMFWVKNRHEYISTFMAEDPEYLRSLNVDGYEIVNYKDWQSGQGHRFAALRVWYVIRKFGVEGLQENIRNVVSLSKYFESLLRSDKRFQIIGTVKSGLVCYRYYSEDLDLATSNAVNKQFLEKIEEDTSHGHIVSSVTQGIYFLRFVVNCHTTLKADLDDFWAHSLKCIDEVLKIRNATSEVVEKN
eukprot:TRINITY_DN242_c0_g1_i7.p1 TRINITY_DN242_c0_g1~~TRINITY_DN242_c0_g1_i7.p1  ORF type:complete len:536 (+),score=141.57 TRINITY_DN242_c0_g1_i7:89-1696(+)